MLIIAANVTIACAAGRIVHRRAGFPFSSAVMLSNVRICSPDRLICYKLAIGQINLLIGLTNQGSLRHALIKCNLYSKENCYAREGHSFPNAP
jgi:hypothetical protein